MLGNKFSHLADTGKTFDKNISVIRLIGEHFYTNIIHNELSVDIFQIDPVRNTEPDVPSGFPFRIADRKN
ncbi:hypothetical protein JCM10550A_10900 [Methanogenium cariaci]